MYRDPSKIYFYNKVVTPKKRRFRSTARPYYFVLHYDEEEKTMGIIPLVEKGTFDSGKRAGRIRWKAAIADEKLESPGKGCTQDDLRQFLVALGVVSVPCSNWDIVPAHATNKGTGVAEESWDIFD